MMFSLATGMKEKKCGRGRLAFLTVAMMFCGTSMIYYMAMRPVGIKKLKLAFPVELSSKVIGTAGKIMGKANDLRGVTIKDIIRKPSAAYDESTYGIKLFECRGQSPMASEIFSKISFKSHDKVDNVFIVLVTLYDDRNNRRTSGGDVLVIWAEQLEGDGRVSGVVIDNRNGTYTGKFKIFWRGETIFKVKIASTIENQCLRSNALYKYGNTVYAKQKGWGIFAVFKSGYAKRKTKCGANPNIYQSPVLCNFTTMNANLPWFCGAPPDNSVLNCSNIHHFTIGHFDTSSIPSDEKMHNLGHGVIADTAIINVLQITKSDQATKCFKIPSKQTWRYAKQEPSGYWARGRWNFIYCDNSAMTFTYDSYRTCLKGKHFAIIGDSTVRHIAEFFLRDVLDLINNGMGDGLGTGPQRAYQVHNKYQNYGVTVTYSKHEFPFHNIDFPPYNITSMPLELKRLEYAEVQGKDLIVLLHYNLHLQAYPTKEFRLRIRRLIPAIKKLLIVKPGVKILVKGTHVSLDDVRWFDPRIALIYMDILHREFRDIQDHVIYLDTWSITVAHNSELPHPSGNAFISQIQQIMSYVCKY